MQAMDRMGAIEDVPNTQRTAVEDKIKGLD
jgi:hypothetical protein